MFSIVLCWTWSMSTLSKGWSGGGDVTDEGEVVAVGWRDRKRRDGDRVCEWREGDNEGEREGWPWAADCPREGEGERSGEEERGSERVSEGEWGEAGEEVAVEEREWEGEGEKGGEEMEMEYRSEGEVGNEEGKSWRSDWRRGRERERGGNVRSVFERRRVIYSATKRGIWGWKRTWGVMRERSSKESVSMQWEQHRERR